MAVTSAPAPTKSGRERNPQLMEMTEMGARIELLAGLKASLETLPQVVPGHIRPN